MSVGAEPGVAGLSIACVACDGAPAIMEASGIAVGLVDCRETLTGGKEENVVAPPAAGDAAAAAGVVAAGA